MFKIVNPDLVNIKEVAQGDDKTFYIESMDIEKKTQHGDIKIYHRDIMNFKISGDEDFVLESSYDQPTKFKLYDDDKGVPKFIMTALKNADRDYTKTYLLCIPFNGILKPIEIDPKYRIYKGLMVTSRSGFNCNFSKYYKCLYLLVEPNLNLFNPEHKYHTDEIRIDIDAFDYRSRNGYSHVTTTITFDKDGNVQYSEYSRDIVKAQPDDWYIPDPEIKQPIWQTFKFEKKEDREARDREEENKSSEENNSKPSRPTREFKYIGNEEDITTTKPSKQAKKKQKRGGGKNSKDGYISGDYYITKNKNGIRQEIPLRGRKHKIDKYNYEEEY